MNIKVTIDGDPKVLNLCDITEDFTPEEVNDAFALQIGETLRIESGDCSITRVA